MGSDSTGRKGTIRPDLEKFERGVLGVSIGTKERRGRFWIPRPSELVYAVLVLALGFGILACTGACSLAYWLLTGVVLVAMVFTFVDKRRQHAPTKTEGEEDPPQS